MRSKNTTVSKNAKTVIDAVRSERNRKEELVTNLLKPMVMNLEKTESAFKTYNIENLDPEEKILFDGNSAIQKILGDKASLIPADLKPDADRLAEHYEDWLKEYDRLRRGKEPQNKLVFAPNRPFPAESATKRCFKGFTDLLYQLSIPYNLEEAWKQLSP